MDRRLLWEVVGWLVLAIVVVVARLRTKQASVGLVAGYIVNLGLIHWPAAVTYLLPWYDPPSSDPVKLGFEQCFYGIIGFTIGAAVFAPFIARALQPPRSHTDAAERRLPDARLPYVYIFISIVSYLFLGKILGRIPTVSAMVNGLRQLIVVGICLLLWHSWWAKQTRRFVVLLLISCLLPMITIVQDGFLSYGAIALISIMVFVAMFIRPRFPIAILAVAMAYIAFSFYVTYMRDRVMLRSTIWGGSAIVSRVSQLANTVGNFEWFDARNPLHLDLVNARLNQNYLVGVAVSNLNSESKEYAHGKTISEALFALIPRAIWPDKPVRAGSGNVVAEYTGIGFAEGTSVGVGQVMEFYINFGTVGVIIGFMFLGIIISLFDTWAAQRLWAGDWLQFAIWYLPGLGMMQAGGALVELAASAGSAMLAVLLINRYVIPTRYKPPMESAFL